MPIDFRASQIQTNKIIASGSTGTETGAQIVVYSHLADDGTAPNQGFINQSTFVTSSIGTDIFLYVSGGIGQRNVGNAKSISCFGGDVHISGNLTVDGTYPSGGGGGPNFFWSPSNPFIEASGSLAITGSGYFKKGLSGSLQQVAPGVPYLLAGPNITIATNSLGQVSITGSASGGGSSFYRLEVLDYYSTNATTDTAAGQVIFPANQFTGSIVLYGVIANSSATATGSVRLYNVTSGAYVDIGGVGNQYLSVSGTTPTIVSSVNLISASNFNSSSQAIYELQVSSSNGASYGFFGGFELRPSGSFTGVTYVTSSTYYTYISGTWEDGGNKLATTSSVAMAGNLGTGYFANNVGSDVFFFVSGNNGGVSAGNGVAVFGGDVIISGVLYGGSPLKISGSMQQGYQNSATGLYSHAQGSGTQATYTGAHSEGATTIAAGNFSHAEGDSTVTLGIASHAEGQNTNASGQYSHAEGNGSQSAGSHSHAEGRLTQANGQESHAEGEETIAGARGTHTEGYKTQANAFWAHAEGELNLANGRAAHAEGLNTHAEGEHSHAEGEKTWALGIRSHAEGWYTTASVLAAHAEGSYTNASGAFSHAEGIYTFTFNDGAHSEGSNTQAKGGVSHAEGEGTVAEGDRSHSEGYFTYAFGTGSHAEGAYSYAYGTGSHTEGYLTTGSGNFSHAEGSGSVAFGSSSHAEGHFTLAYGNGSHAEGYYTVGFGDYSHAEGGYTLASGYVSHTEGLWTTASNDHAHAEGEKTVASGLRSHAEGYLTTASALAAHSEGSYTTAAGAYSHAEGIYTFTFNDGAHSEGSNTQAKGGVSHAEGEGTVAEGDRSHSEGYFTYAFGTGSHAEGAYTYTYGTGSHTEGYLTTGSGNFSHAEGLSTEAIGTYSHAGGIGTIASGSGQTVIGSYNLEGNTDSLFVIGDGKFVITQAYRGDIVRVNKGSNPGYGIVEVTGSLSVSGSGGSNGTLHQYGGLRYYPTIVTSLPYTASLNDYIIGISASAGPGIELPASEFGRTFIVKDVSGSAASDLITITAAGGELIDGSPTATIGIDNGSYKFVYFGSGIGWGIV